jgi:hypothetical protein
MEHLELDVNTTLKELTACRKHFLNSANSSTHISFDTSMYEAKTHLPYFVAWGAHVVVECWANRFNGLRLSRHVGVDEIIIWGWGLKVAWRFTLPQTWSHVMLNYVTKSAPADAKFIFRSFSGVNCTSGTCFCTTSCFIKNSAVLTSLDKLEAVF